MATLGYMLMQRGKYADAEQVLNEAMQIERGDFGVDNHAWPAIEANLGTLYEREGDPARAMKIDARGAADHLRALGRQSLLGRLLHGCGLAKLYLEGQ